MTHSFDTRVAEKVGVNAAVIFNNIFFWVEHNRANEKNFHDGMYWTYNSNEAFKKLFSYMSKSQIGTALDKLEKEGLIVTGTYNDNPMDRTKWYSVTDDGYTLLREDLPESPENEKCISEKSEMDLSKIENANQENGKSYIYINNKDIYTDKKQTDKKPDIKHVYGEYRHVRLTDKQFEKLKADFGEQETDNAIRYLDEYIQMKGYKANDHNLAMRKWVFKALQEQRDKERKSGAVGYDWANL